MKCLENLLDLVVCYLKRVKKPKHLEAKPDTVNQGCSTFNFSCLTVTFFKHYISGIFIYFYFCLHSVKWELRLAVKPWTSCFPDSAKTRLVSPMGLKSHFLLL